MKKLLILSAALWGLNVSSQNISKENITKHVYVLASDSLAGRKAGTDGGRKAVNYIVSELRKMGKTPVVDTSFNQVELKNIVCEFEGVDPKLKNEKIVVVAHYDHLGTNEEGEIFPGANDNATSSAALLEIVRDWKPTKRTVVFMWSDGEEMGMLGSKAYVGKNYEELDKIKLAISCEMLGQLNRTGKVTFLGDNYTVEGVEIVKDIAKTDEIEITTFNHFPQAFLGATDTAPFLICGVPVMVWFVDANENYHKTTDTAESIDYDGVALITKHIEKSIRKFADVQTITPTEIAKEKK